MTWVMALRHLQSWAFIPQKVIGLPILRMHFHLQNTEWVQIIIG